MDSVSRILWWLFASSSGARSRTRLVRALREEPRNAQQLAELIRMDYSTVRHHLEVLVRNRLLESTGPHYGQVYSLGPTLEARWDEFERIVRRQPPG